MAGERQNKHVIARSITSASAICSVPACTPCLPTHTPAPSHHIIFLHHRHGFRNAPAPAFSVARRPSHRTSTSPPPNSPLCSQTQQLSEEARVVCIRFGSDVDPDCMAMDEHLYKIADKVQNFAVIYVVDNKVGIHPLHCYFLARPSKHASTPLLSPFRYLVCE